MFKNLLNTLNVLFVVRKSLQTCLQRESPSSRPAPWQRRASCRLKPRWETADSGSLWSRSVSSIWSHRGCHLSFRRATSSSLIASTPRWRARRSTMFSTGCTWPCPPRGMRRSVNQLLNGTLKTFSFFFLHLLKVKSVHVFRRGLRSSQREPWCAGKRWRWTHPNANW